MMSRRIAASLLMLSLPGCHCAREAIDTGDSELATGSSSGDASSGSSSSEGGSTGEPFDASRFIGRYHFENLLLPFGERGNPGGTYALINLEILPDRRATVFHDNCAFDEPTTTVYEWAPSDDGWLSLGPGPGDAALRFLGSDPIETLRVQLIEPCREVRFEVDGTVNTGLIMRPGESCWVDRCTNGIDMQVDYCEGEQPPPCP